jgi:large subunit ribosomal protein L13
LKTYISKKEDVTRRWYLLNAKDRVLGRLATQAAALLMGKGKPEFVRFMDVGDFVVVINADKIRLTGKKTDQKMYRHHTLYIGHLKEESARHRMQRNPESVLRQAVEGMLPKNKLGKALAKKLKVYAGEQHPHEAQAPVALAAK